MSSSAADTPMTDVATPQLTDEERQIYDRQLRVWGVEAQKRMRESSVLLIGVRGLSCEVAKNIVLAGIGSLVLLDDTNVELSDLSANFLVSAESIGQNRAESSVVQLRQLNPNVQITANTASLTHILETNPSYFKQFRAICMVSQPLELQIKLNNLLRQSSTTSTSSAASSSSTSQPPAFFTGECFGFYSYFFEDLQSHTFTHTTKPKQHPQKQQETLSDSLASTHVSNSALTASATNSDEEVIVTEIKTYTRRLEELFELTATADTYPALQKKFGKKRLEKAALERWLAIRLVLDWRRKQQAQNGSLGSSDAELKSLLAYRDSIAPKLNLPATSVTQATLEQIHRMSGAELSNVCAVVGGILGQEILKILSGKDEPLSNLFIFSSEDGYGIMKEL